MKRLSILIIILTAFVFAFGTATAADTEMDIELVWSQSTVNWENLKAWDFAAGSQSGGGYDTIKVIPKPETPAPGGQYTTFDPIKVFILTTPGETVTKYFVIRGVKTDDTYTAWSAEEMRSVEIPNLDPLPPNDPPVIGSPDPPQIVTLIITLKIEGGGDPPVDPPNDPPVGSNGDTAIIFINGLNGSARNANQLFDYLESQGYDRDLMFAETVSPNSSMCSTSHLEQVEDIMSEVWNSTTADNFALIGHSRGGTIIYNFMWFSGGADLVTTAITLAGANLFNCNSTHGEPPADKTAEDALYTNIWSPQDGIVPQAWSVVEGANNVSLPSVGHLAFISNQAVFAEVLKALQGGGSNN